jgi:hypothetical protein
MVAPRSESERFTITYDGPALAAGQMNAQVLGAAMLSMAQLVETSTALIMGATTDVKVDVVADFKSGSFSYQLVTAALTNPDIIEQVRQSITMGHVLAVLGITGGGGLFGFIRFLNRRKIKSVERHEGDNVRVTTEDGDSTVIHADTINLFNNSTIRVELNGVVKPLREEGITELRTGRTKIETRVRADEAELFEPPELEGEVLQDKTTTEYVSVVGPKLLPGRRWEFQLPDGTAFTSSVDEDFTKRVMDHLVGFFAGDALEVELRTVTTRDPSGRLRARREIVKVIRKVEAPKQLDLLKPPET